MGVDDPCRRVSRCSLVRPCYRTSRWRWRSCGAIRRNSERKANHRLCSFGGPFRSHGRTMLLHGGRSWYWGRRMPARVGGESSLHFCASQGQWTSACPIRSSPREVSLAVVVVASSVGDVAVAPRMVKTIRLMRKPPALTHLRLQQAACGLKGD